MDLKKAGCKKQGQCYSKRDKVRLSLLFLNNNDPTFCTLKTLQNIRSTWHFRIVSADWPSEWKTWLFVCMKLKDVRGLDKLGNFLFLIHESVPGKIIGHYKFFAIITEIYDIFCFAINDRVCHYISLKCYSRSPVLPTNPKPFLTFLGPPIHLWWVTVL